MDSIPIELAKPATIATVAVDGPPEPSWQQADGPLDRAMASIIAEQGGRRHTIVDVLHGRALRPFIESLRQYLAIRLGDMDRAEAALQKVRAVVAARGSEALAQAPGVRARLFGLGREIAMRELERDPRREGALPWRGTGGTEKALHLAAIRDGLSDVDSEVLELRHARELRPREIAFVLSEPVEAVMERLELATEKARRMLRKRDGQPMRRLLLEAFALQTMSAVEQDREWVGESEELQPGSLVAGRYVVQARVGTGAFGDVYRATDAEVPGHVVALKLLHQPAYSDEARQSALRELRLIASVFHPSVVQFKDHGWHRDRLWFVMPWYEGETLESRLNRAPLSREEALQIFTPLARALEAMHAAGIRHQDVKPDNIFLAELAHGSAVDGEAPEVLPVLIDLGVAATEAERLVAGTPTYFAPEVAAQFATVDHKPRVSFPADVFSLALSLRNALEPETQEDVPAGAVDAFIETRARERPPRFTNRKLRFLESTFDRWFSLDPHERPTAGELAEELEVLMRPERRRERRGRLLRFALPLFALVGGAFAATVWHFEERAAELRDHAAGQLQEVRSVLELEGEERRRAEELLGAERSESERLQAEREALARRAETLEEQRARQLRTAEERIEALDQELGETRRIADELRVTIAETEAARTAERERLEGQLAGERRLRAEAQNEATELAATLGQKEAALAGARARLAAADARADDLEESLADAIAARHRAVAEARAAADARERAERRAAAPSEPADPSAVDWGAAPEPPE
ncbi:MAG: protein kinase [Deltaproteobacteria bacterium]|nr:protein kinase [Deltaproteobacteria bacterium]